MNITKQYLDYRFKAMKQSLREPITHQKKALVEVVHSLHNTLYAFDLGLNREITTDEYIDAVPLSRYANIESYIEQMRAGKRKMLIKDRVRYFGESSGTTGRNKTIPLSKRFVRENLIKGSVYTGSIVNHFVPDAASGKMIVLPGSLKDLGTCYVGDVSAVMAEHIPLILRPKSAYHAFSNVGSTWSERVEAIIESINQGQKIMGLSGLPTWNLKLLDLIRTSEKVDDSDSFFQGIKYFVHGGISIEPYRERFKSLFGNNKVVYINVYNSTEGFFAFQDDPDDEYMSLFVDGLTYYEFIPLADKDLESPRIFNLEQVEPGKPYVMVVSNNSGLYRYIMEDVVVFGSVHPFKLKIMGRTSGFLNVFGEEVMEDTCNKVIDQLVRAIGVEINDYTIAPKFKNLPSKESMGCHEWVIEFNACPGKSQNEIAKMIDKHLKELSHDYSEKRKDDLIMSMPLVTIVTPGSFLKYLNTHRKIGVQTKIPRISKSRDLLDKLYALS